MDTYSHRQAIKSFLSFINDTSSPYVLKGGTSLMECYGLDRFSEDVDLDCPRAPSNSDGFKRRIDRFCAAYGYEARIAKNTDTVSRAFIRYDGDLNPLKVEVSYRRARIDEATVTVVNGIRVYSISEIAIQKAGAYLARDKMRDLYDLTFIINNYLDDLSDGALSAVTNALEYKDLDQFDYLMRTQDDPLIDKDKLAGDFLAAFDNLGLLAPDAPTPDPVPDEDADLDLEEDDPR